jgi:hypothetical protein
MLAAFRFVEREKANHEVSRMCKVLSVSPKRVLRLAQARPVG